ncbi:MAG TPA: lamin tail domain-containing protein, partial [Methylomirabilota bacterium]|nr:lamin tail domain-containing protein [Methylomirabilota bacterium]
HYVGVIPGQTAGAVVQFYVRATDSLGAAAMFPARGPDSGALYKVEDGQADLALAHNFRIVMTPDNINLMHGTAQGVNQTNVMSNELLPCTIIYDERRVYYDCGVHLRGSQRGRYNDVRTGFHVNFQPDDLFRGVHPVMLIDRSGAGDATGNRQEEVVIKHMLNRAGGIPGTYTEICRVLAPRSAHTGPAQLFPRHEDVMIETLHDNGNDGKMFEMELIYYPITANAAGYKNPQPDNVIGTDITDLGNDKEFYRYNFMIKNHRDADDYSGFIALAKAWSLTGEALDEQTRQLMDLDQWMRAYAIVSLCAVGDTYTFGNNHNFFTYQRPSDGKFEFFPWDMDFAFSRGANAGLVGDQNLGKIVNRPANLRRFYAHCLDIINICFNTAYMAYWTDHYDNFAPGQNYGGSLTTIGARATFVRNTINTSGGNAPFAVAASNLVSGSGLLYLSGTAPVGVQVIKVNGVEYPVTWTSVTAWRIALPAPAGTNDLEIAGHDLRGQPMPGFVRTVRIENPVPTPDPTGAVVINEIMYNPLRPEAAYVELYNRSSSAIDLSGWRLNGLDYTFPPGSFITNGQYLVLAASMVGYNATLGASAPVPFAEFPGNLQNDGETLTLFRPGPDNTEIVVDKVRYESLPPWPISANGTGPSLQLIDAGQDNSRVANWSDGQGWRFYSFTGTPGANATNLLLFLATAGDVYIDDLALVEGPAPGVGFNFVANGDFESGALAPWRAIGQHSNTVVSSEVAHSGNHSLHIVAGSPGGVNSTLAQAVALSNSSAPHTLSFWFLPSTNGSGVSFRLTTAFRSLTPVNYRPVFSSPGTANTVAGVRPPFPDLWLNEVQPENTIGLTDSVGEREPWIEIYNAGTNVIDLAGCFLTDNYSNLTRWAFPPNSSIAPGEFKIIIADGEPQESTATEWHASFRPSPGTGTVALAWTPLAQVEVLDYLNYAFVRPGRSYGAWPDAQPFDRQEFHRPTPGAPNDNTPPPATVFLNEWMASNTRTLINTNRGNRYDDWFEIYNPADTPADLAGYTLTDNLSNPDQFVIPQGYVVPARGFLLVWADGAPELNRPTDPALHVNFSLRREGEAIGLYASDGTEIDAVTFEPQFNDYSQGRVADGQPAIYFLAAATPAAPNSGWANRPPVLDPIDDAVTGVGETLTLIPTASDPDSPPQTWQFSLVNAPAGAAIDPVSGVFTWMSLALSTNTITVRVTDNGTPALSATRSFTIVTGIRVVGITPPANGEVRFAVSTIPGKTYQVEYKNNLADPEWTPLGPPQIAADGTLVIIDSAGAQGQRFYRVIQTN